MRKIKNDNMSLAGYLVVEKPNDQVRKTLFRICTENHGVVEAIKRPNEGSIEVYIATPKDSKISTDQVFKIFTVDEKSGEIVSSREMIQTAPKNGIIM